MIRPLLDVPWPVAQIDTQTGRLYHAEQCYGDDEHPFMCVCGLEQAEVDAALLGIEDAS